jgi:hypothetical protein
MRIEGIEKGKSMKALSLRQPWPWFILRGGKHLENRGWTSSYRGMVLIHSSKWWDQEEIEDDFDLASRIARDLGGLPPEGPPRLEDLRAERGLVVGCAVVVGGVVESDSPWFFGPKAFVLSDPTPFAEPVPCRGDRGLFDVPREVEEACLAQIDRAAASRR